MSELEERIEELEKELKEAHESIEELEEEKDGLEDKIKELQSDISSLEDELEELDNERPNVGDPIICGWTINELREETKYLNNETKFEYFMEHFDKITEDQLRNIVEKP